MSPIKLTRRSLPALLGLASTRGWAQDSRLVVGTASAPVSVDPHYYNFLANNNLAQFLFSRLVELDPLLHPVPGLALNWQPIGDQLWEFKLRPGVKWHDGRDFTADDAAFTMARIRGMKGNPGGYSAFLRRITQVEAVDPLTVRFHTSGPDPVLPNNLAFLAIISRHAGEGATTEDYNSGKAAIGTGPYRLVDFQPGAAVEMARNDTYFAGPEPWSRVSLRVLSQSGTRSAALLAGDVDIIDTVSIADTEALRRDRRVTVAQSPSTRMVFLQPNYAEQSFPDLTDTAGKPLPQNPLRDVRVRRALSLAINRAALVSRTMEGGAVATGQWLPAGFYSNNPAVGVPEYDAARARALLTEAGFPNGFRLVLHTANDRFTNDSLIAQAVAQMWTRIGVQTQVDAQPYVAYSTRAARGELAIWLHSWGSSTGEGSFFLTNCLATADARKGIGANNWGRYSNPALNALIEQSNALLDPAAREKVLQQAVQLVADEVAMIPLLHLSLLWGLRQNLRFTPNMIGYTSPAFIRRS